MHVGKCVTLFSGSVFVFLFFVFCSRHLTWPWCHDNVMVRYQSTSDHLNCFFLFLFQSTMWTATTCCDGVSVCSTRGFTGVFTLWTSHHHGDQDWHSALWSMPSDHISCKMAQNWSLWKLLHNAADKVVRVCSKKGSPLFDTLNCYATYRNLMRPWGAVFVV